MFLMGMNVRVKSFEMAFEILLWINKTLRGIVWAFSCDPIHLNF